MYVLNEINKTDNNHVCFLSLQNQAKTLNFQVGKQSQLLLQPTEVELGLQVRVEIDKVCNLKHSATRSSGRLGTR